MPPLETRTQRGLFSIYTAGLETIASTIPEKMANYVRSQIILGRSRQEIFEQLEREQAGGTGFYADILSSVNKELDAILNREYQVASNEQLGTGLVKWTLNPDAEHCDSCLHQASLPPRLISEIPLPTTQPTHGETNCGIYCKCTLEPIDGAGAEPGAGPSPGNPVEVEQE